MERKLSKCKNLIDKHVSKGEDVTLDLNTLNSLLPRALQNSLHLSLGDTPAYFGIHCFMFPL